MSTNLLPDEGNILSRGVSRRKFLAGSGAAIGGAAFLGAATFSPAHAAGYNIARSALAQGLTTDMDILQFALTLEHIEATAYRVINGSGLLSGRVAEYFKTFGASEDAHVVALTGVINGMGGKPVQAQASYNFPKLNNQDEVVAFFAQVEELGAGAYLGAAPLLQDKNLLAAAASIHDVEGQHASVLRAVMNDAEPSPAFASPKSYDEVIAAVTPILTVGGTGPVPSGMPTTGAGDSGFATPLVVVAGLGAAAVGALLRVRSRENRESQEETTA